MRRQGFFVVALVLLAGASALGQGTPPAQDAQAPAVIAPAGPPAFPVYPEPTPVVNRWQATLYGFVEFDAIHDNTQSMTEIPGNPVLALPSSPGGTAGHGRTQFTIRNTRVGFRFAAPEFAGMRASAMIECDFFGNQPPAASQATGGVSEAAYFNNPTFRIRHAELTLETPVVDFMFGQYWELLGWQSIFQPATVELQGVPGELYSRTPQVRISKTLKFGDGFGMEIAAAALRPWQRDSQYPDGQGGIRFFFPGWMGWKTTGGSGSGLVPAGIGISGIIRGFKVPALYATNGKALISTSSGGFALDALIPLLGASRQHHGNALTLTGEYVNGSGITDLYTSFTGGVRQFPASVPAGSGQTMTQYAAFSANGGFDAGNLYFDKAGNLSTVGWQSYIVGLQYYLPGTGQVFVTGTYSNTWSGDSYKATSGALYTNPYYTGVPENSVFTRLVWYEAALWWDVTSAVRLAGAYAYFKNYYGDHSTTQQNYRFQFSAWYIF